MADELSECIDKAQLYYMLPFEKGYLGERAAVDATRALRRRSF